eukprot:scaffold83181_cov25-Tisochrysis_lutea.AAC.7
MGGRGTHLSADCERVSLALSSTTSKPHCRSTMRAALVFPTPGGPESSAAFWKPPAPLAPPPALAVCRFSSQLLAHCMSRRMWSALPTRWRTSRGRYFSAHSAGAL